MGELRSLEGEYAIIDSNFQHFCASHSIFSVDDFLVFDLNVLAALADKHSTSERLKQGITQVLSIIDSQHRPWLNGLELLEDAELNKRLLPTGCERIDVFLQGGFREGQVTELVGPSSSGKTQVCLKSASNVAKEFLGGVVYVDTGNSFSPNRVAEFVMADKEVNHKILQNVLKNIVCQSAYDIFTLLDVLHQLKSNLTSQVHAGGRVRLLIVDSISSLITPVLGGSNSQGRALMVSAGSLLKKIAFEHNIAVLVTNHMVGGDGGTQKPALGECWKSVPHVRLQLLHERGNNIIHMSLLRHPYMASGKTVKFMLCE